MIFSLFVHKIGVRIGFHLGSSLLGLRSSGKSLTTSGLLNPTLFVALLGFLQAWVWHLLWLLPLLSPLLQFSRTKREKNNNIFLKVHLKLHVCRITWYLSSASSGQAWSVIVNTQVSRSAHGTKLAFQSN